VEADPNLRGRLATQTAQSYQIEAARLLALALEELPADDRPRFWRDTVERDGDLATVRGNPQFMRLAARYAKTK
jgi:hypothetical protein